MNDVNGIERWRQWAGTLFVDDTADYLLTGDDYPVNALEVAFTDTADRHVAVNVAPNGTYGQIYQHSRMERLHRCHRQPTRMAPARVPPAPRRHSIPTAR